MHLANSVIEQATTETQQSQEIQKPHFDSDELARVAGMLVDNLKHEMNPKFQQSQFMGLMKQLRDGEVIVEGNKMVENDERMRNSEQINSMDLKGKGKERTDTLVDPISSYEWKNAVARGFLPIANQEQPQQEGQQQEDPNEAYFRQENIDYTKYWQEVNNRIAISGDVTGQQREWDKLQEDWDHFEATSSGIKQIRNYQFQENNPYLLGDASTRHHVMHGGLSSVIEVKKFPST